MVSLTMEITQLQLIDKVFDGRLCMFLGCRRGEDSRELHSSDVEKTVEIPQCSSSLLDMVIDMPVGMRLQVPAVSVFSAMLDLSCTCSASVYGFGRISCVST